MLTSLIVVFLNYPMFLQAIGLITNLILIMINYFQTVDCQQLVMTPNYCFKYGFCQFRYQPNSLRLCDIQCGSFSGYPSEESCYDRNSIERPDYLQCPWRNYDYSRNNLLRLVTRICEDQSICSNRNLTTNITIFETPTFVVTRPSLSVYDSIEHGISFTGTNFNALYQPYVLVYFNRSKLVDEELRLNCSLIINCTIVDSSSLNCSKPPFRDECLPKVPSEFGRWAADFTLYSHNLPQSIINKRLLVYQVPTFNGFTWNSEYDKFFIQSNGDFYLRPKVFCVDLSDESGERMVSNVNRLLDHLTFQFDINQIYKKTLNCSIVMDRHEFPLGTGKANTSLPFSISKYLIEILFVFICGFIFFVTFSVWRFVIRSHEEKRNLESTGFAVPFMTVRGLIQKHLMKNKLTKFKEKFKK